MENLELIILLLFIVSFLALLSYRYKFPLPLILVGAGIGISLVPGQQTVVLQPSIVFLIFLPPLLYAAAWNTSWRDFRANLRPIILAAIGLVLFTTTAIAVLIHTFLPSLGWPLAFLFGAIVSPPDAVAATTVTKGLGIHPRIITILEGESLLNDASALITYKYALATVMAGTFSMSEASLDFLKVFGGGVAVGLALGYIFHLVHKLWVRDSVVDVTLTLLVPFTAYLLAEKFHLSGVLAVVVSGLYLSFRSLEILTNDSRIKAYAVWDVVIFILNALVFILMGLQLRYVTQDLTKNEIFQLICFGSLLAVAALIVRFLWTIPAAILPRILSRRIREGEYFDKRNLPIFTLAGIRGIVSMAAALSIPLRLPSGEPFPLRSQLIFLTFVFIVFTLVVQGSLIPIVIRRLKIPKHSILEEEYKVREGLIKQINKHIESGELNVNEDARRMLLDNYKVRYHLLQQSHLPKLKKGSRLSPATQIFNEFAEAQLELLEMERKMSNALRRKGRASEEVLRKLEREIDLEEARLRLELYGE